MMSLVLVRLWGSAIACVSLVELGSADRARVIFFEPVLDAATVEGMIAGQLTTSLSLRTLLEADVAVGLFALFFLRKVGDEVRRAAVALRSLLSLSLYKA